ncbi:cytosolic sulfotransferase 15-like [Iris pallida]|uniref:Sulfotransferase n=1 Tax=Iris pallida TaxID=29817 RepID=A0AAX6H1X3_IRIPA|nr:cytosolic sulfotransferase 15-like [Iris pallida]
MEHLHAANRARERGRRLPKSTPAMPRPRVEPPDRRGCSYPDLCFHDGFFRPMPPMVAAMMVRKLFEARPTDIILATLPKSGTTWLKALLFATVNRNSSPPLPATWPHSTPTSVFLSLKSSCMETVQESRTWTRYPPRGFWPHISRSISYPTPLSTPDVGSSTYAAIPRITSCPFGTLSIKSEEQWWRASASRGRLRPLLPRAFPGGPFWDHMLGYWKASLQVGGCNVLFMRYEELMKDPTAELKRLAEFVGCPFTQEEQANGVLEDIVETCGFEKLSSLEVNKVGKQTFSRVKVDNDSFFRRGVGRLDEPSNTRHGPTYRQDY